MRKYLDIPLTLMVTTVLTVAMLWPMAQTSMTSNGLDKVLHFIAFAVLVLPFTITGRYSLLVLFLTASAFGGAIELIQPSFNRSTEFYDWIADVAGVLFGIGFGILYLHFRVRCKFG